MNEWQIASQYWVLWPWQGLIDLGSDLLLGAWGCMGRFQSCLINFLFTYYSVGAFSPYFPLDMAITYTHYAYAVLPRGLRAPPLGR